MPSFKVAKQPKPIEIDKFLGLNESVGETEIKLGESVYSRNFRITNNFKAQKREGHQTFIDFGNSQPAYLVWHGVLGSDNILLVANNGNLYEYDLDVDTDTTAIADLITEGTVVLVGTLTNAPTRGFYFQNIDDPTPYIYMLNGTEYKQYDGTTFQDVVPYVPTITINAPPSGGGTLFEEANLLTGSKKQTFVGDGSSTLYQLIEDNIDSDTVLCEIDGVTKIEGVDFTVNRTLGQVTFTVAPASESEVIIEWVRVDAGNKELVTKNKYFMDFGFAGNDTNIFMWGNPDAKDRRMRSDILRANYFPINNFTLIGTGQYAITSIVQNNNQQVIFTEGNSYWSTGEFNATTEKVEYPVADLNERIGHVAPGQGQIINNNPVTLFANQFKQWNSTSVENELNEKTVSDNIKQSLLDEDLTTAITFDYQKENEYWVNVGSLVYIWNYFNNTFYVFDNIEANSYRAIDGVPYYGSSGTVEKFTQGIYNDNGFAYEAKMELGFTDFGVPNLFKNSRRMWFSIQPASFTSVDILWETDRKKLDVSNAFKVSYVLLDFNNINFNKFSFLTNRNPQTFRFKMRAKKYNVIKFIMINSEPTEELTILTLLVQAETAGEAK